MSEVLHLKELDLDMINPSTYNYMDSKQGGHKIVVIGAPGTGKSQLIASIVYAKKHIIPVAMVSSGTESFNHFYAKMMPDTFIMDKYDEKQINKFIERQQLAKQYLDNPWALNIVDDLMDNPGDFMKPTQLRLFKNGRHMKMLYILALQYALDVRPAIRSNIDGTFILREPKLANRKKIYDNYASIIPDFKLFCDIMDEITNDYTALYIHNATNTNDWKQCVFWYKAKIVPEGFRFGCQDIWEFHHARYGK